MNIALSCLFVLAAIVATNAEADPQYPYYPNYGFGYPAYPHNPAAFSPMRPYDGGYPDQSNYFRAGLPSPSFENQAERQESRIFLGTVTITVATTTSTSTITTSTTCTTSAKAISICSPSGRRRRGLGLNLSPKARGLFYNDEEDESETGSIFTRSDKPEVVVIAEVEKDAERQARSTSSMVPFVVQPGFNAPESVRGGRFLVAFGTSTSIITTTSTYTAILTAACKSTTGYATCSGTGK